MGPLASSKARYITCPLYSFKTLVGYNGIVERYHLYAPTCHQLIEHGIVIFDESFCQGMLQSLLSLLSSDDSDDGS
jgi:hypothetical protein